MVSKLIKRITVLVLTVVLCVTAVPARAALSSAQKERMYASAVGELEAYLEAAEEDVVRLAAIKQQFEDINGYARSREFASYIQVLVFIADSDFGYLSQVEIELLAANSDFEKYLEKNSEESPIGTTDELKRYYEARLAEYGGDETAAAEKYKELGSFFDAQLRGRDLRFTTDRIAYEAANEALNAGDFAGAYYNYKLSHNYNNDADGRMKIIESLIGYVPEDDTDNPDDISGLRMREAASSGSAVLEWNEAKHADYYVVQYKLSKEGEWTSRTTTNARIILTGLKRSTDYDFMVYSVSGKIETDQGAQSDPYA